jgi:hypothetical protein
MQTLDISMDVLTKEEEEKMKYYPWRAMDRC